MQNFSIIGQGVPEIRGGTDTQTQVEDLLYRCCDGAPPLNTYEKLISKVTSNVPEEVLSHSQKSSEKLGHFLAVLVEASFKQDQNLKTTSNTLHEPP